MREKTWKERALDELDELHQRIVRLKAFTDAGGERVSDLHWHQLFYMQQYEAVLLARSAREGWHDDDGQE